jgi:hypothetical protein
MDRSEEIVDNPDAWVAEHIRATAFGRGALRQPERTSSPASR